MMKILLFVLFGPRVSSGIVYENTPRNIGDPEPYNSWTDPPSSAGWRTYIVDAQNLGLLFAGNKEFYWMVDIRVDNTEPEDWATGNLITDKKVLTTCRAALKIERLRGEAGPPRATFCQLYLWEYLNHYFDNQYQKGGSRRVIQYDIHKKCDQRSLKNDIAVVTVGDTIPFSTYGVGPMPVIVDADNVDTIPEVKLSNMVQEKRLCFVGSIGRDYINWRYHLVKDYKVRFRVYYENWQTCVSQEKRLCNSTTQNCEEIFNRNRTNEGFMCFRSRARVGTVCDHDRGSPLVCDDLVVGLVLLGAQYAYCNDRLPMPFIVSQLSKFQEFLFNYSVEKSRIYVS